MCHDQGSNRHSTRCSPGERRTPRKTPPTRRATAGWPSTLTVQPGCHASVRTARTRVDADAVKATVREVETRSRTGITSSLPFSGIPFHLRPRPSMGGRAGAVGLEMMRWSAMSADGTSSADVANQARGMASGIFRAKTGDCPRSMAGSTGVVLTTALTPAKRSKFSDGRVSMRNHGRTGRGLRAVCSRSVSTETGRS